MSTQAKSRLDRDARREAILDVAEKVFLEDGFGAASMSTIAARVGGSKGTLYNYFKSKDELFEAYVQRRCIWQQDEIYGVEPQGEDVADTLTRLGRSYLSTVLAENNLRHFRLITAEAERSPEIGRAFYEAGPRRGAERLARRISEWAEAGKLQIGDPVIAAHQYLGLVQNRYFKARLCNWLPDLTGAQIEAEVAAAVKTFMRAYGAR